ncbi:MAG: class I tRNA ligase family protein, partial [Sphingomonas sp.]|nr:class I tRNA ligase family protein [Sphingomonas sp.]
YEFNRYVRLLTDFANEDLSAFYFDIRKDALYCDVGPNLPEGTLKRRAYCTVLDTLFHALIRYAAPVIVFTAEEVWGTRYPDAESVHLLEWPALPLDRHPRASGGPDGQTAAGMDSRLRGNDGEDPGAALVERWTALRALRTEVLAAIEPMRRAKEIGSGLEARVTLPTLPAEAALLAELFISGTVAAGDALAVARTDDHKCGRCWRHLPEVSADGALCARCTEMVA